MKIFVRFGHDTLINGNFTGATGTTLSEKQVIDAYAPYLAESLYKAGHQVMTYSHTDRVYDNSDDALMGGINAAKEWGAELFVSCHANSWNDPAKSYSMCYYRNDTLSKTLAKAVSAATASTIGITNHGEEVNPGLGEVSLSRPWSAIIIEPMFVSNPSDCQKFSAAGGAAVGRAAANAILNNI
jgi:N-acetylmuramoyl-L-alanine amidase